MALRSFFRRLRALRRSEDIHNELAEEMRLHIALRTEENVRRGMTPDEARQQAERQFGNFGRIKEQGYDVRGGRWLEATWQDVRLALRALRRSPGFTVVTLLTLTLGIGANTAIFSIVNGVALRPLAYPRPAELMYLATDDARPVSVAEYLEFQQFNRSFADVGAFRLGEVNLTAGDRAVRVRSAFVDAHLLNSLRIKPIQGRLLTSQDSVVSAPALPGGSAVTEPVVVISYDLWQSAFGANHMLGQNIELDGRRVQVVGIMERGADLMDNHTEIWLPLGFTDAERLARNNHNLFLIGRLKEGVTQISAQTELTALVETWSARTGINPGNGHEGHVVVPPGKGGNGHVLHVTPLADQILGRAARSIWVLQAAVGLILLIACANIANLLLARAQTRQREFAVLLALGAGRVRLLRKVLTEGVILSLAGGAFGVPLARAGVVAIIRAYPASFPRISEVSVDMPVMLVSFAVAAMCGLLFGLAPLLNIRSDAMAEALKSGARGSGVTTRHHLRRVMVIAETAIAVIVVVGAGLLVQTVRSLSAVDAGFDRSRLATFSISLPQASFDILDRVRAYQRILGQLRAVPGIQAASAMSGLPLDRPIRYNQTEITNFIGKFGPLISIDYQRVMSGFFETASIPIVQGRGFQSTDVASDGGVAIVNEALANTFWHGQNPIGQRLRPGGTTPWLTVIGVAKDVKQTGIDQPVRPEVYALVDQIRSNTLTSFLSVSPTTMHVVIKTTLPLESLASTIQRVVSDVDPAVPVARLREMEEVFTESIRRPRLLAELLTLFAILALLLAAVGIYGLLSYTVAERRREIGIRFAIGAPRSAVLMGVMSQGLVLTTIGIVIGLAGAFALNTLLESLLFGVTATDTTTLIMATALITLVAAVACWGPAWRASRLDPNMMLRNE